MRYLAQRITTGEWLTRDLELAEGQITRALSGPGGVNGYVEPELQHARDDDGMLLLEEWGTFLYAENGGNIRNAGIITNVTYEAGRCTVEAPGFTTYPHGIPYHLATNFGRVDPLHVVRHIWSVLQALPDGNLGLVVDDPTIHQRAWIGDNANPYGLLWWETPDCGSEIDNLARQTPFDYTETHTWANTEKTVVTHRLRLGHPRLGRRRTDLRFVESENLIGVIPLAADGAAFANDVVGIGKGEGAAMVHARAAVRDGRLRRPVVLTDKTADKPRIDALVRAELTKRASVKEVTEITVIEHSNAPIAAIDPGDDILIEAELPWLGETRIWLRVLSITESADGDTATLATRRSNAFTYSATSETTS